MKLTLSVCRTLRGNIEDGDRYGTLKLESGLKKLFRIWRKIIRWLYGFLLF